MHEIDAGVGFQKVAPGALAGMRLAGNQQHAELVADAVDRHHSPVVDERQFIVERRSLDLDDVRACMFDVDVDIDGLAADNRALVDGFAIDADRDLGALAGDALIVEPIGDGLHLPDNAEAGRGGNCNPAVPFVLAAGDQRMERRLEAERGARSPECHARVRR